MSDFWSILIDWCIQMIGLTRRQPKNFHRILEVGSRDLNGLPDLAKKSFSLIKEQSNPRGRLTERPLCRPFSGKYPCDMMRVCKHFWVEVRPVTTNVIRSSQETSRNSSSETDLSMDFIVG